MSTLKQNAIRSIIKRINTGSIIDFVIIGILALACNYVNQALSWNFENRTTAIFSFSIFILLSLAMLAITFRWTYKLFRQNKLLRQNIRKEKNHKKIRIFITELKRSSLQIILLSILIIFLFSLLLFSSFNFSNYHQFRSIVSKNSNRTIHYPSQNVNQSISSERKWAILNTLTSESVDDESLVFATNLNNSFDREIKTRKLPIDLIHKAESTQLINSLINSYAGLYVIRGTYFNNEAELYIENINRVNELKAILTQSILLGNKYLDSLFIREPRLGSHSTTIAISYNSENSVIDKYNLKIGIPNEIKFFVLSTIGDFIVSDFIRNPSDALEVKNLKAREKLEFGLSILALAEESIRFDVNLFGFHPLIRGSTNIEKVYFNIAVLYLFKAQDVFLRSKAEKISAKRLAESLSILNKSNEYKNKLTKNQTISSLDSFVNHTQIQVLDNSNKMLWCWIRYDELSNKLDSLREAARSILDSHSSSLVKTGNDSSKEASIGSEMPKPLEEIESLISKFEKWLLEYAVLENYYTSAYTDFERYWTRTDIKSFLRTMQKTKHNEAVMSVEVLAKKSLTAQINLSKSIKQKPELVRVLITLLKTVKNLNVANAP